MPDTQFSKITLNADHSLTAEGPYDPLLTQNGNHQWQLVGKPVVVFQIVKTDAAGNPDLVADAVGTWTPPQLGQPFGPWTGTVPSTGVPGDMKVGDPVRAIGAAIQIKTDGLDLKNPPVVEVVTWCVPQTLSAP